MENISIFSECYLSICFLFIFVIGIFSFLSKKNNFPNYYNGICSLIIFGLINAMFVDVWNRLDNFIFYDLFKDTGDIYMKFIIILLVILFLIYSICYVKNMNFNTLEFLIIIFFITININYFILTTDIISFYLLLEIQSLSFYLLTAFNKKNQYSVESGLKYFILSSFSSVILLFGFSFIYGVTGTLNISEINLFFSAISWNNSILKMYIFSLLLVLLAFFFKLYLAPFHIWVSDIYQGSPTMSTAFFGTITSLPLFYIWCKYYLSLFTFIEYHIFYVILIVTILSMLFGAIGALYQKKIKRLIAFSSVSNIGYVFIGFLEENMLVLANSFNYLIIYTLNAMSIFVIFLNLYSKKLHFFLERLSLLYGFFTKNKLLAVGIIIFFFAAAGMPPFSLFIAKILLLTSVSHQIYSLLLFIVVFTSIIGSFYYLRIIKTIVFDIRQKYIFISSLYYMSGLFILLFVIFQLFFLLKSEYVTIIGDYITLNFYSLT